MRSILERLTKVLNRADDRSYQAGPTASDDDLAAQDNLEAVALLRDFLAADVKDLGHDSGPLPHFEAPVRLRPVMPLPGQEMSGSWLGGLPMLPDDMPWPILADTPALFLAQIDCTELPPGLWGGIGPRAGWLAFFVAQDDRSSEVCVRHVDGPLTERLPPAELVYPTTLCGSSPLSDWVRPDPGAMPRWPIRVEPLQTLPTRRGTVQKMDLPDSPRRRLEANPHMREELMPFDWPSALLLLYVVDEDLERWGELHDRRIEKARTDDQPDAVAETEMLRAGIAAAQAKLAQVIETAERASGRARFSDEAGALIVEALHRIKRPVEDFSGEGTQIRNRPVIDDRTVMGNYLPLAEVRARHLYVADPTLLPPLQRTHFEELWTSDSLYEHGHMGGRPGPGFRRQLDGNPVMLLTLPTSDLVGWMWGDRDDLGIFLAPDALQAGAWDRAQGAVSST